MLYPDAYKQGILVQKDLRTCVAQRERERERECKRGDGLIEKGNWLYVRAIEG